MRHAKLLSDLAQVALEAGFVLHHRSAADHFQIGDLGKVSQDFILHAVSKEGVCFLLAEVFKWQDCDRFFSNRYWCGRGCRRRRGRTGPMRENVKSCDSGRSDD